MSKRFIVLLTAVFAVALFAAASVLYRPHGPPPAAPAVSETLARPHAPVIGRATAPVTVVEFFDPACESCRAMYPIVKQILAQYPDDVRLVLRYAPLHKGSDQAVRIIEAARSQDKLLPVLEALLEAQPVWADHGRPDIARAWTAAAAAGLDLERARRDAARPELEALIRQDVADLIVHRVKGTPTFFVNGRLLPGLSRESLQTLVDEEVAAERKRGRR